MTMVRFADHEGKRLLPPVVPPINFSLVAPGVYRSGHPNRKNSSFLRTLKLKGVMYVEGSEEYRKDGKDFVESEGVQLHRFDLSAHTDLFTPSGREVLHAALSVILDTRNHPLLIHDDSGKSTCTLICSLIRRMQGWSLTGIFAEGDMFAGPAGGSEGGGVGEAGREFIALFDPREVMVDPASKPSWAN
ncbi:cytoplasm protein [Papiliotrema laurentii]|uniref:Cytoplasm protein n=1 Tax=Papiliotrema laurentii TaxID=5418 RepID=A0AAD9L7X9_PAPLA|nr:cytoplasm protein [Papiliotrema laurentii]